MSIDVVPPALWWPAKPAIIRAADISLVRKVRAEQKRIGKAGVVPYPFFYKTPAATFATRTNTFIGTSIPASNNYNWVSTPCGTAAGTSLVVVIVQIYANGTNVTLNNVTIDGTNGTLYQNAHSNSPASFDAIAAIAYRATSNTSITITLLCTNGSTRGRISVYRLNNLSSATPFHGITATNSTLGGGTLTNSLNIPAAGLPLTSGSGNGVVNPIVLTGITQDASGIILSQEQFADGSDQNQSASTGHSIQATNVNALASASWA